MHIAMGFALSETGPVQHLPALLPTLTWIPQSRGVALLSPGIRSDICTFWQLVE